MSVDNYATVIEAALENSELPRGPYEALRYELLEDFAIVKAGEKEYVLGSLERDKALAALADLIAACHPEALRALLEERKAMQAKIDALMLEFCPAEMSHEQIARWAQHQVALDAAITTADNQEPPKGQ